MLSLLESGNGKAIVVYYLCLNSGAQVLPPLSSSNQNSLLLSNWATFDNREMRGRFFGDVFIDVAVVGS